MPLGTFWVAIVVFILALTALALVVFRYGPRRGAWNQPAAAYRSPGRRARLALMVVAALHVIVALGIAIRVDGAGVGIVLVGIGAGAFYALCAQSLRLAEVAQRRRRSRG
jgi:hypothetical protein